MLSTGVSERGSRDATSRDARPTWRDGSERERPLSCHDPKGSYKTKRAIPQLPSHVGRALGPRRKRLAHLPLTRTWKGTLRGLGCERREAGTCAPQSICASLGLSMVKQLRLTTHHLKPLYSSDVFSVGEVPPWKTCPIPERMAPYGQQHLSRTKRCAPAVPTVPVPPHAPVGACRLDAASLWIVLGFGGEVDGTHVAQPLF